MEVLRPTFGRIFFLEVQLNSQKILVKKTKQKQNSGAHREGSREEEKRGDIGQ